jgi:GT2 family glycosyltransferase
MAKTKVLPFVYVRMSYIYMPDGLTKTKYCLNQWDYKNYTTWYWKESEKTWVDKISDGIYFDTHREAYNCLRRLRRRGQLGPGMVAEPSELVIW